MKAHLLGAIAPALTCQIAAVSLGLALPAQAQRIVDVTPGINAQAVSADALVSGLFEEPSGTVDASSVRILLDGEDVTAASSITSSFFSYRPAQPLAPGSHQVQIEYATTQGEQRAASWSFSVEAAQPEVAITSVTHNATEPLAADATLLMTINGTPGLQASVLLISNGNSVRTLQAQEVSPGVYVASYRLPAGAGGSSVAVGRLTQADRVVYGAASQPITVGTAAAAAVDSSPTDAGDVPAVSLQPAFTSHDNGSTVSGSGFTLVGQTQPGASVTVTVDATTPVAGGFLNIGSTELVNRTVTASASGEFTVAVPAPLVVAEGTTYTVKATARLDDTSSPETRITLTQD